MPTDGRGLRRLAQVSFGSYEPVAGGPYDGSWSPDGKRIAFVRGWSTERDSGADFESRAALCVINADGTGLRSLTAVRAKVEAMSPLWSPDGRRIVFSEHDYSQADIRERAYVIDADGTHKTRLPQLDGVTGRSGCRTTGSHPATTLDCEQSMRTARINRKRCRLAFASTTRS
jgi:Tol biopolymer transport system component